MAKVTMDKIVNLCKNRGFIFQGSEIYGGMGNTWDYGPIGVELKNNIKKTWWKKIVQEGENSFGVDAAILMNRKVWEASGHVASFGDPKMDCKECKTRHRADTLVEGYARKHNLEEIKPDTMSKEELEEFIREHKIGCPNCGKNNFTEIRNFNPMFETSRGVTDENQNKIYLRPETAQGQYVNFANIQRSMRAKVPFGIANIGKAFRNEITPGNFIFRTIEFEQMEHQLFCHEKDAMDYYNQYKQFSMDFFKQLGVKPENLRYKDHDKLAHYAQAACDVQYNFPFGWEELNGTHLRGTWDLTRHQEYSGKKMNYTDPYTRETFTPTIVEHTIGADRLALVILCDAYDEEALPDGDSRVVMHFHPTVAPYKVAILPLQKNGLTDKAKEVYRALAKHFMCTYDEAGSIGKRYRRQDEIGTPFCVTIDFQTLEDEQITVRERDSMQQIRMPISRLVEYIKEKVE